MITYQDYNRLYNIINRCNHETTYDTMYEPQSFNAIYMTDQKQLEKEALEIWENYECAVKEFYSDKKVLNVDLNLIDDYIFFCVIGNDLKRSIYKDILNHLDSLSHEERVSKLAIVYGAINILTEEGLDQETVNCLGNILNIHMTTEKYIENSKIVYSVRLLVEAIKLANSLIKNNDTDTLNDNAVEIIKQLGELV